MSDIAELADQVRAELGSVEALFVNAGITSFVPFEEMTEEVYDQLLTVNAKGPYFTVQRLAPLLSKGSGVVLTTSIVNAVSPGPIDTGIVDRSMPKEEAEQTKAQLVAGIPMLRFGESSEVAKAVAFLAFDATYTTGAELPVDGGGSQL